MCRKGRCDLINSLLMMTEKVGQLSIIHHVDDRVISRRHDSLAEHNLTPAVLAKDIGNILKDIAGLSKEFDFLLQGFRYDHTRNVPPEPGVVSFRCMVVQDDKVSYKLELLMHLPVKFISL